MTGYHPGQEEKACPQSEGEAMPLPPVLPRPLLLGLTSLTPQGAAQGPGTSAAPGSLEALQHLKLTHIHRISICILTSPPGVTPVHGQVQEAPL